MAQTVENAKVPVGRLASLDALRGFDMFWIMGGLNPLVASGGALDGLHRDLHKAFLKV